MARKSKKADTPRTPPSTEERIVKKYYPVFENLILFVLGRGEYWKAVKKFIQRELSFRGGLFAQGFIFLVAAGVFVGGAVVSFTAGSFYFLRQLTGSSIIAAFSMSGISLVLAVLLILFMASRFRKMLGPHPESELARNREKSDHIED